MPNPPQMRAPYALNGLPPVTATITAPMTKARRTEPRGIASPRATRRRTGGAAGGRGRARPGGAPVAVAMAGRSCRPMVRSPGLVRRGYQGARLDLSLDLVELGLELRWNGQVVDRVTGAAVLDLEGEGAAGELVVDHVLDRGVRRHVDLLQGARDHGRVGGSLVGVDPDAVDV